MGNCYAHICNSLRITLYFKHSCNRLNSKVIPIWTLCSIWFKFLLVLSIMFRSRNLRRTLSTEGEQRKSLDQDIRISTMLVAVVLCFLLCNTLVTVSVKTFPISHISWSYHDQTFKILIYNMILNIAPWNLTDALIIWKDILALSNPCLNSIIFYVFLPKYRLAARRLIFCRFMQILNFQYFQYFLWNIIIKLIIN